MNCPQCGKEMQSGWLYGRALWSPKQGKASLWKGKEDVHLIPTDAFVENDPVAHICKDCRKVVVEY